jgi:hypothetical protein
MDFEKRLAALEADTREIKAALMRLEPLLRDMSTRASTADPAIPRAGHRSARSGAASNNTDSIVAAQLASAIIAQQARPAPETAVDIYRRLLEALDDAPGPIAQQPAGASTAPQIDDRDFSSMGAKLDRDLERRLAGDNPGR